MKSFRTMCIAIVMALSIAWAVPVNAAERVTGADVLSVETAREADSHSIQVDVDGNFVAFTAETGYPYVDERQRTLVPLRAAMEALGCQVSWESANATARLEKDGIQVSVPVGESYIRKGDMDLFMDTKSVLENGRVYLPIRAVAEAFGAEVQWNQETKTVLITPVDSKHQTISIHFIDVGHGDAILIDDGTYEVLIDAGTTSSGGIVSDYIRPYVDGSIDLLIATHGHQDHVGGIPRILEDYQADRIIESGSSVNTPEWKAYKAALEQEPDCQVGVVEDEIIELPEGAELRIIKPPGGQALENNNSIAALLTYQGVSTLFTGDSQSEEEEFLAQQVGKVDVFKGGHHGSYNANSSLLLEKIRPQYIVISAGKGVGYTHPHASALKRMFSVGATVYGTFKSGTIIMKTDGRSYSFETAAKPLIPLEIKDAGTYQKNIW
ncbi:MBL fold metallo-hydrolase [Aminipila butyrica]|uniref:MBL fold metallo-hydrolase n=1 Tax=Aminipila butyrica TaxID=433296 RepID=A0A858BTX0_9FIRM|nr:stalk domain-containing protein [Aminipila butyrica]QIB68535.1 MBL fold metallo-hydrolase [Aminipila butyrica]